MPRNKSKPSTKSRTRAKSKPRIAMGERVRRRLFGKEPAFVPDRHYAAIPWILRRAQWLFKPRLWQIYTYVWMRTSPEGIAWFPLSELAYDLDYKNVGQLKRLIDELVENGWVRRRESKGRDYFLVRDPVVVLTEMASENEIDDERLEHINELLETLEVDALEGG